VEKAPEFYFNLSHIIVGRRDYFRTFRFFHVKRNSKLAAIVEKEYAKDKSFEWNITY